MPVKSEAYNMDCMEAMRTFPDNYFDLAVVDPPYGGGAADANTHTHRRDRHITGGETPVAYLRDTSVTRTGGTWAEKYGKKS